MDHELIEPENAGRVGGADAARTDAQRGDAQRDDAARAHPEQPSAVGNAAFTRTVGRAVDRSGSGQGAGPLDPETAEEIQSARKGGDELSPEVAADMGHHLGADFSGVRVHTDARADSLSRSVQAEAFTTGSDIFFRSGRYAPGGGEGRRLLAHELTHVVQQSEGQAGPAGQVSHPADTHELEAKRSGDAVSAAPVANRADASVSRQAVDEEEEPENEVERSVDRQEMPEEEEQE